MTVEGFHLKLDGVGYMIDEGVGGDQTLIRPHYIHQAPTVQAPRTNISGSPGKENLKNTYPLWAQTDWSGGQELKITTDPATQGNRYDNGLCNPRYPGQLSGVPTRTDSNITPTSNFAPILVNAIGYIWIFQGLQTWYSSDGSTWTNQANGFAAPITQITQAVGGSDALYAVGEKTPGATDTGQWRQIKVGSNATFVNSGTYATENGFAYLNGLIYGWAKGALKSYDTTATFPVVGQPAVGSLYSSGPPQAAAANYYGACTSENSVILMEADDSNTRIHQYIPGTPGVGALLWNMPSGFSGRAVTVVLGVVYVAGVYVGGQGALFGMSLRDQIPQFISYIGATTGAAYIPVSMAGGPGDQVLIGMSSGEIFVYVEGADAISQLDVRTGFTKLTSVATYKAKRMAAWEDDAGTKIQASYWGNDIDATTTSGTLISPAWDLGYPEENKDLIGEHLVFKPIIGNETITVSYQINEDAVYHVIQGPGAATGVTVDKNVPGAATGNVYIPISVPADVSGAGGTVFFRLIRTKIVVNLGAICYAATVRTYIGNYEEFWEIVLQITDDPTSAGPPYTGRKAPEKRDALLGNRKIPGIIPSKKVVLFQDGYKYAEPNTWTEHQVTVELVGDIIHEKGKGNCRVILRSVAP